MFIFALGQVVRFLAVVLFIVDAAIAIVFLSNSIAIVICALFGMLTSACAYQAFNNER